MTRADQALSFHEKWMREDTEHMLSNFTPPSVCPLLFLASVAIPGRSNFKKGGQFSPTVQRKCPSWKYPAWLLFVAEEEEACSN